MEGDSFLKHKVAEGESWIHYFLPETNREEKDSAIPPHQNLINSVHMHLLEN